MSKEKWLFGDLVGIISEYPDNEILITGHGMCEEVCPLCKRKLGKMITTHHLIPVLKGGTKLGTALLHRICHDKIHSLFSERELQVSFNTIEKLLTNDKVINFVNWVQNKPIDFYDSSKKNKK